jgi:sigma-B regulation protein RsbU (phosphoserine phosphatase)
VEAVDAVLRDDDPSAFYERAPCGYLSTLPDGTITRTNETFLSMLGCGRAELLGRRRFAELLTGGGRIYHETHFAPLLQMQGRVREIALDLVRADGARLPVLVNAVLERDGGGRPVLVRLAVFDATERREYERELLRAKERAEASEERAQLLARTLQQTLIPPAPPVIPGLDVAAVYRPASTGAEVGGDFYDIFALGAGDWMVAIGDVCGKGVDAAVVTALARHTIRAAAVHASRPSEVLATLNEVLRHHPTKRFCTVAVARMRQRDDGWTVTLSCGGHPPALLQRGGAARPLPFGPLGTLLGVFPVPDVRDEEAVLRPGDRLLLFTDGVTEGRRGADLFGEQRLVGTVASSGPSAAELAGGVLAEVEQFQSGDLRDDVAIVAVCVR